MPQVQSYAYTAFGEQMGGVKVSGFTYNAEAYFGAGSSKGGGGGRSFTDTVSSATSFVKNIVTQGAGIITSGVGDKAGLIHLTLLAGRVFSKVKAGLDALKRIIQEMCRETEEQETEETGVKRDPMLDGEPRENHNQKNDEKSLPARGEPNSSTDLLNSDGTVKQRRYYDSNGKAEKDIDFNHTDDGTHEFSQTHDWDWTKTPPRQTSTKGLIK